jgi:alpha-glucoside transport system permease protein
VSHLVSTVLTESTSTVVPASNVLAESNVLTESTVLTESSPKLGQMVLALLVFFGVLLIVFLAAGRATGRFQRPVAVAVLLGPAILLLAVGLVIPAVRTVMYSFQNDESTKYVGLKNYEWAFTNPDMRTVLLNTVLWIIVAPLVATGFGLVLALLADRMPPRAESITKSLIFLPMAISFVGASIIWKFVYEARDAAEQQVGLLSQIVILLHLKPQNWLLWQPWNNALLMVIMIWVETGFAMVVLSAAIKAIPADVIEAAQIDGAVGWNLFRRVTIPLIRGTLVVVLTTIMITVLKVFDIVMTMTGGNFGTSVLSNEMWQQTFVQFSYGHGTALAVILFLGVVPLVVYNVRMLRRERSVR